MRYGYPSITGHPGYTDDPGEPDDEDKNGESSETSTSDPASFILGYLLILFILGGLIALIVSC